MVLPAETFTERLLLRPPAESDAAAIFARYAQDRDVCRYLSWAPHRTIDDTIEFVRRITADNAAGRSIGYLIFAREGGELLGSIGGAFEEHRIQFGYCLASDAWGRGFATEAGNAFIRALSESTAIQRVQAYCDVENNKSARVLQKLGLQLEGTLRQYLVLPNLGPTPRDVLLYATTRGSDGAFASNWPTVAGNEL